MKKLGFGMMRMPLLTEGKPSDVDREQVKKMVDRFLEEGFTYFDTAWMYHAFQSEHVVKEVLVDRHPRESYTLADKLHHGFFNSLEDRDKVFEAQREKTGVSYFDYYLLHGIEDHSVEKYEKYDCFHWLRQKKAEGLVRHIGFSFHGTPELLERLLTENPDMEFVQLQLNYLDWESKGIRAHECYETAVRHGVPVIVMEPVKGGTLANVPEDVEKLFKDYDPQASAASWAIRFVASLPDVMVVLSGMSSLEQMEDNLSYMKEFKALEAEEYTRINQAVRMINSNIQIPCTGCSYCTEGCPMNIPIPTYFALYNADFQEVKGKSWLPQIAYYNNLTRTRGKAGDCIACGQCEGVCPQHLPIIELMEKVSAHYDK